MYCRIQISATSEMQANHMAKTLVEKKLVAGTMILNGNCHYWWEGMVTERLYWTINAFSIMRNKESIIQAVKTMHNDICPVVTFNEIDGNADFLKWIDTYVDLR